MSDEEDNLVEFPTLKNFGERLHEAAKEYEKLNPPVCPHCGSLAPYGDARHAWITWHLEAHIHRWWWKAKAWYARWYGGW